MVCCVVTYKKKRKAKSCGPISGNAWPDNVVSAIATMYR